MRNAKNTELQRLLIEILEQDDGRFGMPLLAARQQLIAKARKRKIECNQKTADETILQALDDWTVDKALAPVPIQIEEELNLEPPGPFWHLKILTPEEQGRYKSLAPVEKALIRLLRKQDEPGRRGEIPVEEAEKQLAEQGFTDIPEFMWVNEIVHDFFGFRDGKDARWYGIVNEYWKTEEFKEHEQRMLDESLEKQRQYIQLMEDLEEESRQRRKREEKESHKKNRAKKPKQSQNNNSGASKTNPCNPEWLRAHLVQIVEELSWRDGAPLPVVERRLLAKSEDEGMNCGVEDIQSVIQRTLDDWTLEKTISEIPSAIQDSLGYSSYKLVWHLKIMSEERAQEYRNLEPVEIALIRILQNQNEPDSIGSISVSEAERRLSEQGFEDIPEFMLIKDIVEEFFKLDDGEMVRWYGLIEEFVKTEEYKKQEQKMIEASMEKEYRYIQLMEDLEEESRQRRKREERIAKQQEIKEKKLKQQKIRKSRTVEPKPCNQDWLRTHLIQTVEEVGEGRSAPLVVVQQELIKTAQDERIRCSLRDIHHTIESVLDEWILDKTVIEPSEYMLDSLGYCASEVVWGLKILSDDEIERYRNLKPIVKELISLLRERDDPRTLGMMPVSEAHRLLSKRGFDDIPELICEEGIIQENHVAFDGEEVPAYEIVQHYC
ncbi:MAG: hypothetical protein GF309_13445 [Candidatus Lokiarchaeota archaeon]|nr:hypothetical protein [Candidatus Lokiarchaeota archaeon]